MCLQPGPGVQLAGEEDSKDYEGKHLFVFRDGVYYNDLETKLWVKGRDPTRSTGRDTVLLCKHKDMNEGKLQAQDYE